MTNLQTFPADLPVPTDDGGADHLRNLIIPSIPLRSTANRGVNLAEVSEQRTTVVYCYPMTGVPGQSLPNEWDKIPGARGCTPKACKFRDSFSEFQNLDFVVFRLSTQTTEYQKEMASRLQLPFEVLS